MDAKSTINGDVFFWGVFFHFSLGVYKRPSEREI